MTGDRLSDLYTDRAIWGLDQREQAEFVATLRSRGVDDDPSWERAAAMATVVLLEEVPVEPAPAALIAKLEIDAQRFFAATPSSPGALDPSVAPVSGVAVSSGSRIGWYAAAAAIAVACWLGWDRYGGAVDPVAERSALVASAGAVRIEWQPGPSARRGDPSGDVVWSPAEQRGFMRFRGLPANDPKQFQYQLWIFDGARSDPEPVDGGVFDISDAGADTVVPIDAKLRVGEAVTFAVTIEPTSGVVVSKQEHIVTVAKK